MKGAREFICPLKTSTDNMNIFVFGSFCFKHAYAVVLSGRVCFALFDELLSYFTQIPLCITVSASFREKLSAYF